MDSSSPVADVQKILEPLTLEKDDTSSTKLKTITKISPTQQCLLCDQCYDVVDNRDLFLKHLFENHRLVIGDVNLIADLPSYIKYWRHRFSDNKIEQFCTTMLLDKKPDGTPSKDEKYYLLSDVISEDKTLRFELQQTRLSDVLEQHRKERSDQNFQRRCWFCHLEYTGSRVGFFTHLSECHNLQLGQPEKLVFTTELLDIIDAKLNSLQCIYCEKIFKDRCVLKEHMRKKMHKRINPENQNYDKYYLVNYKEIGQTWQNIQKDKKSKSLRKQKQNRSRTDILIGSTNNDSDDENNESNSNSDWSEWNDEFTTNIYCLFCNVSETDFDAILTHMNEQHTFNFSNCTNNLKFYDKIRLVNYIRRQIYLKNCIFCDINFDTSENLMKHMTTSKHYRVPDKNVWNQVEYLFPTYEDDSFLCFLDDTSVDGLELDENVIIES